jgi:hypothetical protein
MHSAGIAFTITCQNTEIVLIWGISLHDMHVKFSIIPVELGYVLSQLYNKT